MERNVNVAPLIGIVNDMEYSQNHRLTRLHCTSLCPTIIEFDQISDCAGPHLTLDPLAQNSILAALRFLAAGTDLTPLNF